MSEKQYRRVPKIPQDFEAACEWCREATRAIEYWSDQKQVWILHRSSDEYKTTLTALKQWKRFKAECETVVKSYQLSLF